MKNKERFLKEIEGKTFARNPGLKNMKDMFNFDSYRGTKTVERVEEIFDFLSLDDGKCFETKEEFLSYLSNEIPEMSEEQELQIWVYYGYEGSEITLRTITNEQAVQTDSDVYADMMALIRSKEKESRDYKKYLELKAKFGDAE